MWCRLAVREELQRGRGKVAGHLQDLKFVHEDLYDAVDFAADLMWTDKQFDKKKIDAAMQEMHKANIVLKVCIRRLSECQEELDKLSGRV